MKKEDVLCCQFTKIGIAFRFLVSKSENLSLTFLVVVFIS